MPIQDAMFIDVMVDLSRKLGERVARQSAGGLAAAQQERREAMKAYDRARRRQQLLTAGVAIAALIALGIASLAPPAASPVDAQSDVATQAVAPPAVAAAPVEPAPPVMVAAAQPTLLPPTTPSGPAEPPASNVAAPNVVPEPLAGEEVREVQKRLRAFGFNPGPVDGVAGPMTANAVASYRQSRGQQQIGDIDRDLLDQLRQDPSPQVAQAPPPQRTAQRARPQRPAHRETPLDQLGRWLHSLVR